MGRSASRRAPVEARRARRLVLSAVVVSVLAASSCGDPEDASFCTAYGELVDARVAIEGVDFSGETAAEATELAESMQAGVQRLTHAADGRYSQELNSLEAAVTDLLLTLQSVRPDEDYATWGPLVQDDYEAAVTAADQLDAVVEPSCNVMGRNTFDGTSD